MRISDDATGVVIDVRGDDAGADDGKEEKDAATPLIAAGEEAEDTAAETVDEGVDGGERHGRRGVSKEWRVGRDAKRGSVRVKESKSEKVRKEEIGKIRRWCGHGAQQCCGLTKRGRMVMRSPGGRLRRRR